MVAVRVYVEGGGNTVAQARPLRIAVATWIAKAVPEAKSKPTVVACGGRAQAYEEFARAVVQHRDSFCILLVDSEGPLSTPTRWGHVKQRVGDGWDPPPGTGEENLHFMAQAMEAWLCADADALEKYFGDGFKATKLPQRPNLEEEPKADLNDKLKAATLNSKKGGYRKGAHLDVLGEVSPQKVEPRCPHAGAFVSVLRARL